jgi:hypothetical protein
MASDPTIAQVLEDLDHRLEFLPSDLEFRRTFIATYRRTTEAVGHSIVDGGFEDPAWVAKWDAAFADLFFVAHDADLAGKAPPRPWRLAFRPAHDLNVLQHLLLGMNAHINFDLPQALLAVISDEDFSDPVVIDRRRRDHERIDRILASRVAAEDGELGGPRKPLDRLLTPLNRASSRQFLREARQKVWRNTFELQLARVAGPAAYRARLAELELLTAAKIADLTPPGQVLLRLAARGFGVTLPPSEIVGSPGSALGSTCHDESNPGEPASDHEGGLN